jgi:REP-associated tyrosine transposase
MASPFRIDRVRVDRVRVDKAKAALLPFPAQHGGRRAGAGRKPKGERAGVAHRRREALASRFPVHVTVKLRRGLPPLRRQIAYAALRAAFAAGCRGPAAAPGAFRLCHYAILNDHLHFIAEAGNREALARGLQGLLIRIAKALNKLWSRRGRVFADRYHDRILRTPRETRNALRYVLQNGKKHAAEGREVHVPTVIDTFTSAPWFDGFRERVTVRGLDKIERPTTDARSWMLTIGWRRHGLLSVHDLPATG